MITNNFGGDQENVFLEGKKKFSFHQKNYRWSKQPINEIIGKPTLADVTANTIQYTSLFLKTQVHALRDFANEMT